MTNPEVVSAVESQQLPEGLRSSFEPVKQLHDTLLADLSDPDGVLLATYNARLAASDAETKLGIAPSLHIDPSRSGVNVERWQMQSGLMPESANGDAEQVLALWSGKKSGLAPLKLPEEKGEAMMALADKMEMRGGGPFVYSREEAARVTIDDETTVHVHGGANKANIERLKTVLELLKHNPDYSRPVIATASFSRVLRDAEREAVREFAPNATTEVELLLSSALHVGFLPSGDFSKQFSDGTVLHTLTHPELTVPLYVVAPPRNENENGKPRTGVYNAYRSLLENEELGGLGKHIVAVTSTHYGPMALVNNLKTARDLRVDTESIRVIGDNQPQTRKPQAHLIEAGLTVGALFELYSDPTMQAALLADTKTES